MDNFIDNVLEMYARRFRILFSIETLLAAGLSWVGFRIFDDFGGGAILTMFVIVFGFGELVRRKLGRRSLWFYNARDSKKKEKISVMMQSEPNIAIWRIAYLLDISQGQAMAYIRTMQKTGQISNMGTSKNPQWVVK